MAVYGNESGRGLGPARRRQLGLTHPGERTAAQLAQINALRARQGLPPLGGPRRALPPGSGRHVLPPGQLAPPLPSPVMEPPVLVGPPEHVPPPFFVGPPVRIPPEPSAGPRLIGPPIHVPPSTATGPIQMQRQLVSNIAAQLLAQAQGLGAYAY